MSLLLELQEVLKRSEFKTVLPTLKFGIEVEVIHKQKEKYKQAYVAFPNTYGMSANDKTVMMRWFELINKTTDTGQLDLMKTVLKGAGADPRFVDKAKAFLADLNSFGSSVFIGTDHGGADGTYNAWRVETDNTVDLEVVSPILSYDDATRQVSKVVSHLRSMGFSANRGSGYHINISDQKKKLHAPSAARRYSALAKKFGHFGVASYFDMNELIDLYKQGASARQGQGFSKTFLKELETTRAKSIVASQIARAITRSSVLSGKRGKYFKLILPKELSKMPSGISSEFEGLARGYLFSSKEGSHGVAVSHRLGRSEVRGLGGSKAFQLLSTPDGVGRAIRLAVTVVSPHMKPSKEISPEDVKKRSSKVLTRAISPVLDSLILDLRRRYLASQKGSSQTWSSQDPIINQILSSSQDALFMNIPWEYEFADVPEIQFKILREQPS